MAEFVFFGSIALILWTYVGYPVALGIIAWLRPRPVRSAPIEPTISLVICAYNEAKHIGEKLRQTLTLDYPADKLEILVASDGSTDGTDDIVREFAPRVTLVRVEPRGGKTNAQNVAVARATGEILVFSDATTIYPRHCLRALVAPLADPTVGCVAGDLIYRPEEAVGASAAEGRARFWSYERQIRVWESLIHSMIGTAGCAYAMRRALFVPLDPAVISDFVEPGQATERGYRTVLATDAVVYEPPESFGLGEELRRRARVITRGLRGAFAMPRLLNPFIHPWLSVVLWSHRVLRWTLPLVLIALLVASAVLSVQHPLYAAAFVAQLGVYGAGLAAYHLDQRQVRLPGAFVPLYFCLVNLAPLLAMVWLLRGEKKVTWETGR